MADVPDGRRRPDDGSGERLLSLLPREDSAAIERYQNESRRLFEVLDVGLAESEWLAGDVFTIADIANWCWVRTYRWSGLSVDGLPNLRRWLDAIKRVRLVAAASKCR